jgi:hypothetical protein
MRNYAHQSAAYSIGNYENKCSSGAVVVALSATNTLATTVCTHKLPALATPLEFSAN